MMQNKRYLALFVLSMHFAYLLTGGNLGNRKATLQKTKEKIAEDCGPILMESYLYETEAWGLRDQGPFLNQALKIKTQLSAIDLLQRLLHIEKNLGRVRDLRYGPRIIDVDILFFDREIIDLPGLSIPHPQLQNRRFVLQSLNDIASDFIHPHLNKTINQLLQECTDPLKVNKLDK